MKCTLCNENKNTWRCKGCQRPYCHSCGNSHREELMEHLESLFNIHDDLKQSFGFAESTWQDKAVLPCLLEINEWEQHLVNRIREIAAKARATASKLMSENLAEIRSRLRFVEFAMEQHREEQDCLDNDLVKLREELDELKACIKNVDQSVRFHCNKNDNVDWNSLISIYLDGKPTNREQLNGYQHKTSSPQVVKEEKRTMDRSIRNGLNDNHQAANKSDMERKSSVSSKNSSFVASLLRPGFLQSLQRSTRKFSKSESNLTSIAVESPFQDHIKGASWQSNDDTHLQTFDA